MKAGGQNRVVFVTCGTLREGRRIARVVVSKRLAACVNIILSPIESFYTWRGNLEKTRERFLVIKTTRKQLAELEKEVKRQHSYDVPEFIVMPVVAGSIEYLKWLKDAVN
jgi:periplasmic divalent cation tolerance protein